MKYLLTFSLIFSFNIFADDHESDQDEGFEPNKAEYYVGKFKKGKDLDDLIAWSKKWSKWASSGEAAEIYKDYNVTLLVPYYIGDLTSVDYVWAGVSPDATSHFAGNEYWFKNGGQLLSQLPVENTRVTDTWQWQISLPANPMDDEPAYAQYSDCTLGDGVTIQDQYEASYNYAKAAQAAGDIAGRKMIFPVAGAPANWNYDYVYLIYTSSISDYGKNNDLFWDKINDLPEKKALDALGGSCVNQRTFAGITVK